MHSGPTFVLKGTPLWLSKVRLLKKQERCSVFMVLPKNSLDNDSNEKLLLVQSVGLKMVHRNASKTAYHQIPYGPLSFL